MTAATIRAQAGLAARAPVSRRLATRRQLVGDFVLGTDFASSKRNLAGGADLTTAVGMPGTVTYGPGYARVTTGGTWAGLDTRVRLAHDMTIMAIVSNENSVASPCPFAVSYGTIPAAAASQYTGFLNTTGGRVDAYNSQGGGPSSVADLAMPASSNYYFVATRLPFADFGKLYLGNAGSLTNATGETEGGTSRGLNDTWAIGPGSSGSAVFGGGSVRIAAFAAWNDLLTDEEILETYLRQVASCAKAGIPVL